MSMTGLLSVQFVILDELLSEEVGVWSGVCDISMTY